MMFDIILVSLLLLGLIGLVALVVKKIPVLMVVDPQQFKTLREQRVKQNLVEIRLRREFAAVIRVATVLFTKVANYVKQQRHYFKSTLENVENTLTTEISDRVSPIREATDLLEQAAIALGRGDFKNAEKGYLEVLRHDQHNMSAFEGLGELYLTQRDYEQAREIYEYLNHQHNHSAVVEVGLARVAHGQGRLVEARQYYQKAINSKDSIQLRLVLANIAQELGDSSDALTQAKLALALEPNNPKTLDFFIELSIVNEQPIEAQFALDTLKEVNSDNQKISEFSESIRKLSAKQKPRVKKTKPRVTTFGLRR